MTKIRKILKWIGILTGSLVGLILLAAAILYVAGLIKWNREYENYDVQVEAVAVPTGEAAVRRGQHVAAIHLCGFCHGENLAGELFVDIPGLAVASAPNLTPGAGGVGATNTTEDWVRAIRHGVGHDRRGLVAMPARVWYSISDDDLGALIAYLQSLPPVDHVLPARKMRLLGLIMVALNQYPPTEAAVIDHSAPRPATPEPGVTVVYGEYLARTSCRACHGVNFNGGSVRSHEGDLVIARNLTPGGELAGWTEEQFITTLRTGVTPSGHVLNNNMPWKYVGKMTDDELRAVWLFLKSLPVMEQGLERTDH